MRIFTLFCLASRPCYCGNTSYISRSYYHKISTSIIFKNLQKISIRRHPDTSMKALRACRTLKKAVEATREELNNQNNNVVNVNDDEPFTLADEDFVMTLMMDCLTLLAGMQKQEKQMDLAANNADTRGSRNKVFMGAISIVGNSLLKIDGMEPSNRSNGAVDQLLGAFSVPFNNRFFAEGSGRGWLPLHWAVVLASADQHSVTKADVETLYSLDPMAMRTNHVADIGFTTRGHNPVHLLCMSPVTPCSMQVVRSFSVCNPTAFGSTTTTSALHAACRYGTPTVELLQHLLQLDSSQVMTKVSLNFTGHCPLGHLCLNLMRRADQLTHAEDLMNCFLEVNKSAKVVGDAVVGCLDGYRFAAGAKSEDKVVIEKVNVRLYKMIATLLKANPEAAMYRDDGGRNLLCWACVHSVPSKLCIDIMTLVLAVHKDASQEPDLNGLLPVQYAASFCDVEVMGFLLGLYPDAASKVTSDDCNLLHLAVGDGDPESIRAVSKVKYLCSRYPAMIL